MRRILAVVAASTVATATLVGLPVFTLPAPAATPVPVDVRALPLAGVDAGALAGTPGPDRPVPEAGGDPAATPRTLAAGPRIALRPAVVTKELRTSSFGLVAVTAAAPLDPASRVVVRVREAGRWGAWQQLPVSEDAPDPSSPEGRDARYGTDPLLASDADGVQVRIDTPNGSTPKGTSVALVSTPAVPADAHLTPAVPASTARADVTMPPIITRAQWGADESLRRRGPIYSPTLKVGFVHHTASTSSYGYNDVPRQLRNLYAYYTKSLKYSDMAYNFLVDR